MKRNRSSRPASCLALAMLQVAAAASALADTSPLPDADYGVSTIWQLGGIGAWSYLALEPSGERLFVSRGDRVDVIETVNGRRATTIPNTLGVAGIAFSAEFKRGYTSNGQANTVTAFALDTVHVIKESPVPGRKPDAILYDPASQHLLIANALSNDLSVLDPISLDVLSSIALPGRPALMATDGAGTVYVNLQTDPGKLVAIDSKSAKIKAVWPVQGCANPTGLALDVAHHRVFSACEREVMMVLDGMTGRLVARVAIGSGSDGAAFDADLGFVFSANGADGTLTVIHQDSPDSYRVIATVQTERGARTLALDAATHRIYLPTARFAPPPPATADQPNPRPGIVPDTFVVLVAEPK